MLMVVTTQLRAAGKATAGYPDDAFMEALAETATLGSCESNLRWSIEQALQKTTGQQDGFH
jgi:hypothetical protein